MLPKSLLPALAALLTTALAKTDLSGCTTSNTVSFGGAYVLWYVPGTGELCAPLDCGGGMAPPKTTVPGCAAYVGTASYVPSYLPGYGPGSAPATVSASSAWATSAVEASATGLAAYTVTPSSGAVAATTETGASTFAVITSAASLSITPTVSVGGNNLTATATGPSTTSQFTGAASAVAVREMLGLAAGVVAGLAML
ncbi:uncharacterized protein BDZ99DRAFT_465842 [Mytilinidion resinicola]|uniref:Uncharacterized protein n=1 Tax=Mytilinidion resinicola TaxID=574789 RepID=A0A6A6YC51_9PEZI|nr:uncharacterized protein BDZ99DRAFT_465842 [Mytilinidion resinicola]KAF2806189.1 hypothetical protein BDZ99DRAFT_465842 [Mytilinidion resinicola]